MGIPYLSHNAVRKMNHLSGIKSALSIITVHITIILVVVQIPITLTVEWLS